MHCYGSYINFYINGFNPRHFKFLLEVDGQYKYIFLLNSLNNTCSQFSPSSAAENPNKAL